MNAWPEVRLDDLATLSNGANFTKAAFGHGLKIIGVRDFGDRVTPSWEDVEEVATDAISSDRQLLQSGDLVFVRSNGNPALVGRCLLVTEGPPATHSAFTIRARPDQSRVDPRFLAYQMRHAHRVGRMRSATGTNITNLNQALLGGVSVRLPPMSVQRRIAWTLGSFDDLLDNNRLRIKLLEEMVQAIYREWFVQLRYPVRTPTDEVFGGDLPDGWRIASLQENGLPFSLTKPRVSPYEGRKPYLATADCKGIHELTLDTQLAFSELPSRAQHEPVLDSVWFGRMAGYQKVLLFPSTSVEVGAYAMSSGYACLACDDGWFGYVAATVMDAGFEDRKAQYATGATQVSLTDRGARSIPWLIPPAEVAKRFSRTVEPMLELLLLFRRQCAAVERARDHLLPALVTGKLDVSGLDLDAYVDALTP